MSKINNTKELSKCCEQPLIQLNGELFCENCSKLIVSSPTVNKEEDWEKEFGILFAECVKGTDIQIKIYCEKIKTKVRSLLSSQQTQLIREIEGMKVEDITEEILENELKVFTQIPHSDENIKLYTKKVASLVRDMTKNKTLQDIINKYKK